MGAPPHLLSYPASLQSSSFSSFSSFTRIFPPPGDPARYTLTAEEKHQQQQQQCKQNAVLEVNLRHNNRTKLKQISVTEPFRERKTPSTSFLQRVSMPKACCRCVGTFATDCAAVSCCPCAVFSLLAFALIDLPSALARKLMIHLQTRLRIKDAMSARSSSRGGDNSHSIFTPTLSYRESSDGEGEKHAAASIIHFSTQSLLEHFEAEHVGFGCLSQKWE